MAGYLDRIPRNTSGVDPSEFATPRPGAVSKPIPLLPENGGPGFPGDLPKFRPQAYGGPAPAPQPTSINTPAYNAFLRGTNANVPSGGAAVAGEQLGGGRPSVAPEPRAFRPGMSGLGAEAGPRVAPGGGSFVPPNEPPELPGFGQFMGQGRNPMPSGSFDQNMMDALRLRGQGQTFQRAGLGTKLPGGVSWESVYDAPDVAGGMGQAGRTPPPASPPGGGGGPGGPPSRGPISGVAAPAATLASMMYSANEQSKDPRSLVYRAVGHSQPGRDMFDLKSYPTSMADVENRGLDTAIAIGELGRGLYNTAMHPIDSVKNAVVGNMTGLAQAMASGYNRLQGNNPNGTRRMPVGPMMMEAPMPAPRDGDPNSPFPDPAATPINKTPARFALDQEDAARQAQRPAASAPSRPQTADERYNAYWKAVAPNGLGDYNMRMARNYALSHTPAKDITAHIGNVMSGQGSYEHARAQAQELPKQTAISLRNAMANERQAEAQMKTAERPVIDKRNPVDLAKAQLFDAYKVAAQKRKQGMLRANPNADTSAVDAELLNIGDRIFGKHTFSTDEVVKALMPRVQPEVD